MGILMFCEEWENSTVPGITIAEEFRKCCDANRRIGS